MARAGEVDEVAASVVERVAAAPKYRAIHPDTIGSIVAGEAAAGGRPAEVEKRARRRLHKAAALFLATASPAELLARLRTEAEAPGFDLRAWCRAAMARHVSTAERLDDIDDLYPTILGLLPEAPAALADVACAYNVLALPWLRDATLDHSQARRSTLDHSQARRSTLDHSQARRSTLDHSQARRSTLDVRYVGYDFNADVIALGREVLARTGGPGDLVHADVVVTPDAVTEEVALLLKTYHCLEARAAGSGLALVEDLRAPTVVVSLPTRGGGGRAYGFGAGHGARIEARATERGWSITTARLGSEEIWAIAKAGSGSDG